MSRKYYAVFLLVICFVKSNALANNLPKEISAFSNKRDLCDHFRGEPVGDTEEHTKYVNEQLEIYCRGTDKQLERLKRKYKKNRIVIQHLDKYEYNIEGY